MIPVLLYRLVSKRFSNGIALYNGKKLRPCNSSIHRYRRKQKLIFSRPKKFPEKPGTTLSYTLEKETIIWIVPQKYVIASCIPFKIFSKENQCFFLFFGVAEKMTFGYLNPHNKHPHNKTPFFSEPTKNFVKSMS